MTQVHQSLKKSLATDVSMLKGSQQNRPTSPNTFMEKTALIFQADLNWSRQSLSFSHSHQPSPRAGSPGSCRPSTSSGPTCFANLW